MQTNLASTPTEPALGALARAGHLSNTRGDNSRLQKWKVVPGALGALIHLGASPSILFGEGELPRHCPSSCAPERRATPDNDGSYVRHYRTTVPGRRPGSFAGTPPEYDRAHHSDLGYTKATELTPPADRAG